MATYQITTKTVEGYNGPHMVIHELADRYGDEENYTCWIRQYDYLKSVPAFYSCGICETRAWTLPYAIYLELYDLCQTCEELRDGDEFVFTVEGIEYRVVVATWPTCDDAWEMEKMFREDYVNAEAMKAERETKGY